MIKHNLASGFEPGISETNKITVGAHPWIYAAELPEYDISPALDEIFQGSLVLWGEPTWIIFHQEIDAVAIDQYMRVSFSQPG